MDSFKVYLPSNACYDIYPSNSPTSYKTRFDRAIDLAGEWEVGVESVFYDPNFDYTNDKAEISVDVSLMEKYPANDTNDYKFLLNEEGKWKGLSGITPSQFEEDPNKIADVVKTLNSLNVAVLKRKRAFTFSKDSLVTNYVRNLYMKITARLAEVLGYRGSLVFNGEDDVLLYDKNRRPRNEKLEADDYLLKYFYADAQRKEARIELKA